MSGNGTARRLTALIRKETRQMLRDRSNLAVGLLLPIVLILLFGYGLSFDVIHAPVAVVLEDSSPRAREAVSGLGGTPYIDPAYTTSMAEADRMMRAHEVIAIVRVPQDFSARTGSGNGRIQVILNGADTNTANALDGYISSALAMSGRHTADRSGGGNAGSGGITVTQRMWFNEAGISTWYLVPGLLVIVITLIGAFLTSLLIAREWERGTLEPLFVTPVRPLDIVLAKLAPYVAVGALDIAICLLAARFLFGVPIRGSLIAIMFASLMFLIVALLLGLFISGATKSQFKASQVSLLASFMPALMLSGFVFDLRNVPLVVQIVSKLVPATHFMTLIKTLFLAGTDWPLLARQCGILLGYAVVLLVLTTRTLRKKLD